MTTAAEWYEVGNFWVALAGVVITLLIGMITLWDSYRKEMPQRRIVYKCEVEPLHKGSGAKDAGLVVHHNGQLVESPRIAFLGIGNDGKRDVPSSLFDGDKPLVLDFAVPVLEILSRTSKPPGTVEPELQLSGTKLYIGPSLLAARQLVNVSLLLNGDPILSVSNPIINVREVNAKDVASRRQLFSGRLRIVSLITAAVSILLPVVLGLRSSLSVPLIVIGMFFVLVAVLAQGAARKILGSSMTAKDKSI
ncbi:hypothetical protein [Micromonospora inositola]|uniref:Uncharacterized protein n=1 Tax=Micromonospora inositola TaxID=47865 RepID=A0A1C5K6A6_9ACTN|nr:hypothetical protein [Micromonospora inositola]SCG78131.1 hypothetical protein GA0070613_6472 [Micromonospora inositola]